MPEETTKPNAVAVQVAPPAKKSKLLVMVLMVLILAAAGGGGFYFWKVSSRGPNAGAKRSLRQESHASEKTEKLRRRNLKRKMTAK